MEKGRKVLWWIVGAMVVFIALFIVFPMIFEGVDSVNSTTNVTQYYGLSEINNLSPALLLAGFIVLVFASGAWIFRDKIKQKLMGGGGPQ